MFRLDRAMTVRLNIRCTSAPNFEFWQLCMSRVCHAKLQQGSTELGTVSLLSKSSLFSSSSFAMHL